MYSVGTDWLQQINATEFVLFLFFVFFGGWGGGG